MQEINEGGSSFEKTATPPVRRKLFTGVTRFLPRLKKPVEQKPSEPIIQTTEIEYEDIPFLTQRDILPQSGFHRADWEHYFLPHYVTKALQNLDWAGIPNNSFKAALRREQEEPVAQFMTQDNLNKLQEYLSKRTPNEVAQAIINLEIHLGSADTDIITRAIELMGESYPNLSLYRGCSFDNKRRYTGNAFAPGDLELALGYAKNVSGGFLRKYPIITMLKFSDLVKGCKNQKGRVGTEGYWTRFSLEVSPYDDFVFPVTTRRLPNEPAQIESLLNIYKQRKIPPISKQATKT